MRYAPLRLIALNQMFGAVLLVTAFIMSPSTIPRLPTLYVLSAFGAATVAGVGGLWLLRRRRLGLALSIATQVVQVVGYASSTIACRAEFGVSVTADLSRSQLMTHWGFKGLFNFWPWPGAVEPTVTVNLLAVVCLVILVLRGHAAVASRTPEAPVIDAASRVEPQP
jgi:hypothetical protein